MEDTGGTSYKQGFYTYYCLLLFFIDVIQLLVEETNKYYNQYLDTPDNDSS